jgi:L-cysteate sulfo-lyase
MSSVTKHALTAALSSLPRVRLAHLPTPLDECLNFQKALGGPKIWIKRDDCTGLAFGGNKVRQHEYILGDALNRGVDVVIQGAASQSNQSRQLAAAAAKLGLDCVLMPRMDSRFDDVQGNALISRLFGTRIVPVPADASLKKAKQQMADDLRQEGRNPMILGMGSERALTLAAVAYVGAYLELAAQFDALNQPMPTHIYVTSQVSTQAGLQAAIALLGHSIVVKGINPMDQRNEAFETPAEIAGKSNAAAALLGFDLALQEKDIQNSVDWVGPDYGLMSPEGRSAAELLARTEGILVDPVYSGKGLAGLVGDIAQGALTSDDRVVFLHTGGLPAIFSYADEILRESSRAR